MGCLKCCTFRRIRGSLVAQAAAAVSGQGWVSVNWERQKNPNPSSTFLFAPAGSKWYGSDQAVSMPKYLSPSWLQSPNWKANWIQRMSPVNSWILSWTCKLKSLVLLSTELLPCVFLFAEHQWQQVTTVAHRAALHEWRLVQVSLNIVHMVAEL